MYIFAAGLICFKLISGKFVSNELGLIWFKLTRLIPLGASLNVSAYFIHPVREDDPRVMASYLRCMDQTRQLCLDLKAEGDLQQELPLTWLVASMDSLIFAAWEKVESGDIAPKQAPWLVLETFLGGHGTPETQIWFKQLKETNQ